MRNGASSYDKLMEGLNNWKKAVGSEYPTRTMFNCVLDPDENVIKIKRYFEDNNNCDVIRIGCLGMIGLPNITNINEMYDISDDFRNGYYKIWKQYVADCTSSNNKKRKSRIGKIMFGGDIRQLLRRNHVRHNKVCQLNGMCIPGASKLFVDTDGNYYPCERVSRCYKIGKTDTGIDNCAAELINKKYIKLRTLIGCRACWAVNICQLCISSITLDKTTSEFDRKKTIKQCNNLRHEYARVLNNFAGLLERNPLALRELESNINDSIET